MAAVIGDAVSADGNPGTPTPSGITHLGQQVAWVWQEVPVPVIAAVHGHALGGGIQIALGADIRIVHPDAQLSVREVHWGLVPDMTGTLFLSRLVGPDVAKELTFTARMLSGREAEELGLATHVSERLARMPCSWPPRSPGAARCRPWCQGPLQPARQRRRRGAIRRGASRHRRADRRAEPGRVGDGQLREAGSGVHRSGVMMLTTREGDPP